MLYQFMPSKVPIGCPLFGFCRNELTSIKHLQLYLNHLISIFLKICLFYHNLIRSMAQTCLIWNIYMFYFQLGALKNCLANVFDKYLWLRFCLCHHIHWHSSIKNWITNLFIDLIFFFVFIYVDIDIFIFKYTYTKLIAWKKNARK